MNLLLRRASWVRWFVVFGPTIRRVRGVQSVPIRQRDKWVRERHLWQRQATSARRGSHGSGNEQETTLFILTRVAAGGNRWLRCL